ncbi:MAG: alkaline phosphatase family protein, partial [Nanoarchaeota archaeon]|nr:alkaline phosphatase family protein [Nanoarchaeota archaeon]
MAKKEGFRNLEKRLTNWRHKIALHHADLQQTKGRFKKKFIAVQIDALPYDVLMSVLNTPSCRFIRSVITDKHYFISKYNCGLPSDTPTVLAGMFYHASDEAVGFRSLDKKNKRFLSFANPMVAYEMELRLKKRNKGVLREGSCYLTTYTGDAKSTFLTMSTLTSLPSLKRIKESNVALMMMLNTFVLIKIAYLSVTEFLLEFYDSFWSFMHRVFVVKEKKARFRIIYPFRRFLYQGIVMEMQRIGALIDMKRGVPRIYLNFHAYDDMIHRRGMKSRAALRVLKQIDDTIKRIYKKKPDDYDFYILSDHGAENSVPFDKMYDEKLSSLLHRLTKVEVQASIDDEGWSTRLRKGIKFMEPGLRYITWPVRWPLKVV